MPTPTPTTAAAATIVQQAARSPSEFQFAHRLLRKLVQDSTFFPEETLRHREYVWFPPRSHHDNDNDHDASAIVVGTVLNNDVDDTSNSNNDDDGAAIVPSEEENDISALSLATTMSTINGSCDHHHHQEEEIQESPIIHKLQQQQTPTTRRRRRRTVSTPLFIDYCLRSHTADNFNTRRRGSLDNTYSHRYNNNIAHTRTITATNTNNNTVTTTTSNNNGGGGGSSSSRERGGRITNNVVGGERATSPTLSFGSSKYSCHSTTNITTNTDSYHEDGTSPVSVCSGSVVSGNVSSSGGGGGGGGGGDDVAVHPTVGVKVGSRMMMRELPFQRTDVVEGSVGQEMKKKSGEKEQSQQPCVKEVVEATGQQQQKRGGYSRTLSRQSSFSDRIVSNQTNMEEGDTPTTSVVVGQSTTSTAVATISSSSTNVAPVATTTASAPSSSSPSAQTHHRVYSIHEKELEFGTILGSGGFGQVRLVRIRGNHNANTMVSSLADDYNVGVVSSGATPDADVATKEEATTNNNESNGKDKYYAMKYLSPTKTSPPPPSSSSTGEEEDGEEKPSIHYVTKFERGIADLTLEARFLSVLSHEHIVKLWFVSEGSLETVFNCDSDQDDGNSDEEEDGQQQYHYQHGYFLLLDALHETLHQRISQTYIPQVIDTPLRIYQTNKKSYSNNTRIAKVQLAKRLSSLKSIALALQYLHEDCNLIYRDIKPSNIGFYRRYDGGDGSCTCGNAERELLLDRQQRQHSSSSLSKCTCNYTDIPKLFDFGLAKELKPKYYKKHPSHSPNDPPTFRLTCATGSRRYMSPEVALREPYNHKADVYSFGMVMYQISALVAPFHALDMKNHEQVVAREGLRPDVTIPSKDSSVRRTRDFKRHYSNEKSRSKKSLMLSKRARCVWPEDLNALIAECWDEDMRKRPEMKEVVERLDACIEALNVHPSSP